MQLQRNPHLTDELCGALVEIWVDVTNAGGTVGFDPPVTRDDIRPAAERSFALVRRGRADLVVASEGERVLGFGFLVTNLSRLHRHWGAVRSLQRLPDARERGVGAAVLAELEAAARDRGLTRIELTVRGATGREHFYVAHGFAVEAVVPGRLLTDGSLRDEVVLVKWLTSVAPDAVLQVRRLDPGLPLPAYAHPGDAGLDLRAREDVVLAPGQRAVVATGIAVALPAGCVGLVHPRSGLAARHGIGMVNAPGTVDAGYRGELKVVLVNHDLAEPVTLRRGERIAQLLVQRVETVRVLESAALDATPRGDGGFGSTGR